MTLHHKSLLRRHFDVLFGSEACQRYGQFDTDKILSANILVDVDQNYSCKQAGFKTCEDYYRWCSSRHFMNQVCSIAFVISLLSFIYLHFIVFFSLMPAEACTNLQILIIEISSLLSYCAAHLQTACYVCSTLNVGVII